jgi:two-component system, chemotaxis family, protein-glutamate methylesterase/glutaminase
MSDLQSDQPSGPERRQARVRVLIVDDSALMRRLLTDLLSSAPEIEIAGTARNGREAVIQAARLKPDVVTLDVEMPEVSGLEALPALLAVHEAPVVMISALTQEGADVTLQALELGAVDFMAKPERNQLAEMRASRDLLVAKILAASQSQVRRPRRTTRTLTGPLLGASSLKDRSSTHLTTRSTTALTPLTPATAVTTTTSAMCIVIGISTGGPQALSQIFPLLAFPLPPILVVQHMPAQFTSIFAERLNRYSTVPVKQAEEGDPVLPDRILIAPGGQHMRLTGHPPRVRVALSDQAPVSGHRPSIDVLFQSAAAAYQAATIGVLMTGMGRDGVSGCKGILAAGGLTLGQDEATSVVYGMNKAAFLEDAIKAQFSLDELPHIIRNIAAFRAELESSQPLH